MTTHSDGGLVVRDLSTGEVLWGLPRVRSKLACSRNKIDLMWLDLRSKLRAS